jgi:hypothetical protein
VSRTKLRNKIFKKGAIVINNKSSQKIKIYNQIWNKAIRNNKEKKILNLQFNQEFLLFQKSVS